MRNVLVHRQYISGSTSATSTRHARFAGLVAGNACDGTLTHAELLTHYCTWVYSKLGSYQQTAAALGLDRRTIKAKVDRKLLKQFTADAART